METKWAPLVSYGLTVKAIKAFLPVDAKLAVKTVRNRTLAVAQQYEAELGDEQRAFTDGCQADWDHSPIPNDSLTVGIDGGYVRDWEEKRCHFGVTVGKRILAFTRDDDHDDPRLGYGKGVVVPSGSPLQVRRFYRISVVTRK